MTDNRCASDDTCTFDEACPFHGSCIKVLATVEETRSANPVVAMIDVAELIRDSAQTLRPVGQFSVTLLDEVSEVLTLELPATEVHPDATKTRTIRISVKRRPY